MTGEFVTSHTTNGVDEVAAVEVLEPVLIRVMGVGTTIEVVRRRIFMAFLITCILKDSISTCATMDKKGTYTITLLVEHEGSDSPSGVGAVAGLATNADCSMAPAVLILGAGDGTRGHQHGRVSGGSMEVEITEVVDGGNDQPMVFLISLPG